MASIFEIYRGGPALELGALLNQAAAVPAPWSVSQSTVRVGSPFDRYVFFKGDFEVDPETGAALGGTVTEVVVYLNIVQVARISGISIPLADLEAALSASRDGDETALRDLFAGPASHFGSHDGDIIVDLDFAGLLDGGRGGDSLFGNGGGDRLFGGTGDDALSGGRGKDVLAGGSGRDAFVFDTAPGARHADTIRDFDPRHDTIAFAAEVFGGMGVGPLGAAAFRVGKAAADAGDRIIHDRGTGTILYDRDGAGGAASVKVATVTPGLKLTHADFDVAFLLA